MAENSLEAIPKYLEESLKPQSAKEVETLLKSIENEPGFSVNLIHVISSSNLPHSTRLAGALFFKNLVRRKWKDEDGNYLLPIADVNQIKLEILDLMTKLPNQLQVQIGESISLIAESDFPHDWQNLIDELVSKLTLDDFVSNKGLLIVAHSIFRRWRPLFRSDELFLEIKMVLEKFAEPFMALLSKVDELIQANVNDAARLSIYLDNLLLLVQIYYDLNCQDIPEFFEDNMIKGMGIIHRYLIFESDLITDKDSSEEIDVSIKIKTSIVELVSLYVTRYADVFESLTENFITSVWQVLNTYVTKQQKFDLLVVKSLSFLTSVIKMQKYEAFFNTESSLREIIERIILPNIYFREADEEQFEDEPINFVRSDLEGSDFDSRRKSSTDFLRELKEVNTELLTNIVMGYVQQFLSQSDWKNKDIAIYLFSSLATKGSVTNIGVTSTNFLVDVVKFFTENIANDLVNDESTHPILKTDAIKYILTFRNQLTKDQLGTTVPLLIKHLKDPNPVVYTYASITVEKLLSMTDFTEHKPVFTKGDIQPYLNELLENLFGLILSSDQSSPEKFAENEFLVKTIMRVLNTSEDIVGDSFKITIVEQLLKILAITSKNPSNPKFSHYVFESLGLLIKYGDKSVVRIEKFMEIIIPNLLQILSEDVQEFVPYTFQILAYLLELLPKEVALPDAYAQLIKPLLSPSVWEFRGNIPAITRLLIAILEQDPRVFLSDEQSLTPLLGVFQKLIASKVNDSYGFSLLLSILMTVPLQSLSPYLNQIAILLLTRLKNSRTEKYVKGFVVFICTLCCLSLNSDIKKDINADFAVQFIDSVQSGVFQQIYTSFILPTSSTVVNLQDKKIVLLGLSEFLVSESFSKGNYQNLMLPTTEKLAEALSQLGGLSNAPSVVATNNITGDSTIPVNDQDLDNLAFGSQFSKLVSISVKPFDPIPHIKSNDQGTIKYGVLEHIKKISSSPDLNNLTPGALAVLKRMIE